jgi:hypothetical protein
MRFCHSLAVTLLVLVQPTEAGQHPAIRKQQKPIETTVCKILQDPSAYNNKLVRVRGEVNVGAEYSLLVQPDCSQAIWLALHGDSSPGLIATVKGQGTAGSTDSSGRRIAPLPVRLVRDSNYREFMHYMEISAKGETCLDEPPPTSIPDCTTYQLTATFTGRIDAVSKKVHEAHLKRTSQDPPDFKGFGHMGLLDAQLVVQSVEHVSAVPKD